MVRARRKLPWHRHGVRVEDGIWRVGVWLGAWALWPHPSLLALALALVGSGVVLSWTRAHWSAWPGSARWTVGLVGIALGVSALSSRGEALVRHEQLHRSRWRGEPLVFPTRVVPGERLYVRSADGAALRVGERLIEGRVLGEELFVIDVPPGVEETRATLVLPSSRLELMVASGGRPGRTCDDGARAIVLTEPPSRRFARFEAGRWSMAHAEHAVRACAFVEGALALGTDEGLFVEGRASLVGPVEGLARVVDELVAVRGREAHFTTARIVRALDFVPTHVAGGDALYVARGRRLGRVEAGGEARTVELPGDVVALAASTSEVVVATNAVEPPSDRIGNHYVEDAVLVLDARTLSTQAVHRTAHRTRRQDHPGAVDAGLLPRALAFDGRGWLVAFAGSSELGRLGGSATVLPSELATPTALAVLADGTRIVVAGPEGAVAAWHGGRWVVASMAPRSEGLRALHAPTRSGLACVSCHVEGGTARHRLGPAANEAAAARVASPLSNLEGTAPYFRGAAYGSLEALVSESGHLFGGWREARNEALIAHLLERARGGLTGEVDVDAFALFGRLGCSRCHAPPAFTDGRARTPRELGRGDGGSLDTPSLVGTRERLDPGELQRFLEGEGVHRVADAEARARLVRFLGAL